MKRSIKLMLLVWIALAFSQSDLFAQWVQTNFNESSYQNNYPGFPIIAATDSLLFEGAYSNAGLAFRSLDWGDTWDTIGYQLPFNEDVNCIDYFKPYLFLSTGSTGSYRSSDYGNNWSRFDIQGAIYAMQKKDTFIFAATNGGLFRSNDTGITWTRLRRTTINGNATGFYSIATAGDYIFTGDDYGEIYRSSDDGDNWTRVDSVGIDWASETVGALAVIGNVILAGTDSRGIFRSIDNGNTWDSSSVGLTRRTVYNPPLRDSLDLAGSVYNFVIYDSLVFAGGINGIFVSKDSGQTWSLVSPDTWHITSLIKAHNSLFAGVSEQGIWRCSLSDFAAVRTTTVLSSDIQIFPNPTSAFITIENLGGNILCVSIMNVLGCETGIEVRGAGSGNVDLDLSKLPSGTYFLKIQTVVGIALRKVIRG
jgi:hypothetical protein